MTNQETQQNHNTELSDQERSVFTLATAEEWRDSERARMARLASQAELGDIEWWDNFIASIDESLDTFLVQKGLEQTSENYSEIKQSLRDVSIDKTVEWQLPETQGEDTPKDKFAAKMKSYSIDGQSASLPVAEGEPQQNNNETSNVQVDNLSELHAQALEMNKQFNDLQASREIWSTMSAKRQGRVAGKGKKHDEAQDDYHAKLQQWGITSLESSINDDDSDTEKNRKVIEYLFEEQAKLREMTTKKLQGTKVGRFVNFMNKGSRKARFAKALGLGVGVGLAGTFIAGAAGAAGAAVAATTASRFVRGYIKGDKHRGMKTAQEKFVDSNNPVTFDYLETQPQNLSDRVNAGVTMYGETFEEDTKREQNKRKKALAFGLGTVAVGSAIGYGIHELVGAGQLFHPFGNRNHTPSSVPDTADNDGGSAIDTPPPTSKSGFELNDFSEAARNVHPGEGWYETFQDMGIPHDHWVDVLQNAGPKLHEQGLAYWDSSANEWRISHAGKLPLSGLKTIAAASKRDGFTLAA